MNQFIYETKSKILAIQSGSSGQKFMFDIDQPKRKDLIDLNMAIRGHFANKKKQNKCLAMTRKVIKSDFWTYKMA